jgi:SpoVK/Ycf46/Vps4 family AAA+-type ATPase
MTTTISTSAIESRSARSLRDIFESGRPVTFIRSSEEERTGRLLREVSQRLAVGPSLPVWTWSITRGLGLDGVPAQPGTAAPRAALDFIAAHPHPAIFHLQDFHEPLRDSVEVRRQLRDLIQSCRDQQKFIVITSAVRAIPAELERSITFIELRPPDIHELTAFVRDEPDFMHAVAASGQDSETLLHRIAGALQGLTMDEARYAIRRALTRSPRLGPDAIPAVLEEKRLVINRSGVIEFIADGTDVGDIGGLENLKAWLQERRKLFQMRDELSAEIVPKGVLLMGIPGCGKSLCVKSIAAQFDLPLYRIDMIEVFSGRHGKPEGAFAAACRTMEDMAPAVLWFDEIEMAVTSTDAAGEQGRIFAFFLTWMQEKVRGLFVAATANRIDLLPAEMIRKGRFDEVFFVDLPTEAERLDIFRIHLLRRAVDSSSFDLAQIMPFTVGWAGAEIEQCVVSAVTRSRLTGNPVTDQDLLKIAVKMVPLSRTMKEQINQIRSWAFERAVRASPSTTGR